ncbi:MAG: T9SS type A sorting domain-containing protein [Emticicia sp.]|nr:T9SS type A sorting domain-containing protein [Emticicia sp.]
MSFEGCSNVNLQWLKNDQLIVGANQKTLEVREAGNYILEIEKFGCKASTNALKISVETILAVGEEIPNFNIEVYPNPTEEKLFVSIPPQINTPITLKMTDVSGKLISNYDFSLSNSQFIDLKSFQTGVYFLVFEMQGKRVVKRIVKNN